MIENQGEILRTILKERGIKQETFANSLGVTRGYVHQMFAKKRFKPEIADKIAEAIGLESTVLLERLKNPAQNPIRENTDAEGENEIEYLKMQIAALTIIIENQRILIDQQKTLIDQKLSVIGEKKLKQTG